MRFFERAMLWGALGVGLCSPAALSAMPSTLLDVADARAHSSNEIHVVINGLASDSGIVRVAIFNDRNAFPKPGKQQLVMEAPVRNGVAHVLFRDLPAGDYAVAAFHDENGNGKFDRGFLGMPKEGYGFSGNQEIRLAPPRFEDAAINLDGKPLTVDIRLNYRRGA